MVSSTAWNICAKTDVLEVRNMRIIFYPCKPTSKERKKERKKEKKKRERRLLLVPICVRAYILRMVPGTFAIYTFSLLVEIKKSLALATGRRQKGNFLFYIRSCLHTILPLLNIVADHHCFAGHSFFPAFLSPQIPGVRRRR